MTSCGQRDGLLNLGGGAIGALQARVRLLWMASVDGLMCHEAEHEHVDLVPPALIESTRLIRDEIDSGADRP